MKSPVALALVCLLGACATTEPAFPPPAADAAAAVRPATPADPEEDEDLLGIQHNGENECTLLIYRNPEGRVRFVLRRHGVFELGLTYLEDGSVLLKERGRLERVVDLEEASQLTLHIHALLARASEAEAPGPLKGT